MSGITINATNDTDHAFASINGAPWDGWSATIANGRGADALVKALD